MEYIAIPLAMVSLIVLALVKHCESRRWERRFNQAMAGWDKAMAGWDKALGKPGDIEANRVD
jgi:hypothetical protein